jgi:hypothetical protein
MSKFGGDNPLLKSPQRSLQCESPEIGNDLRERHSSLLYNIPRTPEVILMKIPGILTETPHGVTTNWGDARRVPIKATHIAPTETIIIITLLVGYLYGLTND